MKVEVIGSLQMILKTRKLNFMANLSTCGAKAGRPAKIAGGPAIRRVVGFVRLIGDYFGLTFLLRFCVKTKMKSLRGSSGDDQSIV
ncbi:MAG: hypothetical protein KI791_01635 [Cyclobacteriaceae bacterium]|nr:hypothetical protein [Cyclobacteriaceae bacterium SS2]